MKTPMKKGTDVRKTEDDSLFGLLSSYKTFNTYFRILTSEEEDRVVIQVSDNPGKWALIPADKYIKYRQLKRLDLGTTKLSVKYLSPEHLIKNMGPLMGMKVPTNRVTVVNNLDKDGYFILEVSLKFLPFVIQHIRKIITMSPQKKYEILEKCLAETIQG